MQADWTRRSLMGASAGLAVAACAHEGEAAPVLGGVRRIRPALDALVPADATVTQIGAGYQWAEGPCWVRGQNMLLFSDVPGNTMYKWTEARGAEVFLHPSGFAGADSSFLREGGSNGLTLDHDGNLLLCDSGDRCISRLNWRTKQKEVIVEHYNGKRFNSPNDVIVHRSGALYFTDPPYGLAGMQNSPLREIPFAGVYRRDPSGAVAVVDDSLTFPNGIAFSPDQRTLYASCSDDAMPVIKAYALGDDGMPTASRVFFNAAPLKVNNAPGNPDGMTVDAQGNLFASGPGGILIISPQAELLGVIGAGDTIANCKFGGVDGKTLFLTSHTKLARIRTNTHAPS